MLTIALLQKTLTDHGKGCSCAASLEVPWASALHDCCFMAVTSADLVVKTLHSMRGTRDKGEHKKSRAMVMDTLLMSGGRLGP